MTAISEDVRQARHWLSSIAKDLRGEVPMRIHESKPGGLGFAPPFHPEFIDYIGKLSCKDPGCHECRGYERRPKYHYDGEGAHQPESRMRAKRALRKLREVSPIEFDVLWLAIMHGLTVHQISVRLSEWEERRGTEQRYTEADIVVLALAGIDKASKWF